VLLLLYSGTKLQQLVRNWLASRLENVDQASGGLTGVCSLGVSPEKC
jgi:hypothetical protein